LENTTFGPVRLYFDNYIAKVGDFEDFLWLLVSHKGEKEGGKGYKDDFSCWRRVFRRHLFDADNFLAQLLAGHYNIFGRGVIGQIAW
jgi:hypothetical protein